MNEISQPPHVSDLEPDLNRRLVSNTLVQFVPTALSIVLGIVLAAVLSRYLGAEGLGEYALVFTYVATFNIVFNDWGLGTIVVREISQRPHERRALLASATALQTVVSCLAYGLMRADALLAVVDAVAGRVPVLVDGGIRSGADVVKALAIGAAAVLVTRPVIWGLVVHGGPGVEAVLKELAAEMSHAMALCGAPTLADIDRGLIWTVRR